ncbi:hypothetical protein LTR28_007396 [Elasticomyces elasticus]|nr:hypothetical protein LTR28_007396 [Elasticomyces elasticus]
MMMTDNSGDTVWLDALSIDQTSSVEKDRVLAVMGDIYSRAKRVAVLFPLTDRDGFKTIYDLTEAATAINANKIVFSQPGQDGHPSARLAELSKTCQQFYEMLDQLDKDLHKYLYWRRAWTFQEWALARQTSITWEGGMPLNLSGVKTAILHCATLTSIYAYRNGAYAVIKVGFPQAYVPGRFETVRRLFPDEQAFDPPGMVDEREVAFDMIMSSLRFGRALGLRATWGGDPYRPIHHETYDLRPDLPESKEERFRHRLCMALDALSASKREARHEADLVRSWASMCNIDCHYDAHESYVAALQKVLHALRTQHKTRIYNFLVNTIGAGGEVDSNFAEYSHPHVQCNTVSGEGKFIGLPIFNGRTDTAVHFRLAIARPSALPLLRGRGVELRKIEGALMPFLVPLTKDGAVKRCFSRLASGNADGFVFTDVMHSVYKVLKETPAVVLRRWSLAFITIPLKSPDANARFDAAGLATWAIIPSDVDNDQVFVAREGLNRTLVLAIPDGGQSRVLAYLTLTDHQSGTLLIPVHTHQLDCKCTADHSIGHIEMTLKSPIRRGTMNSAVMDDRMIRGTVRFEPDSCTAY